MGHRLTVSYAPKFGGSFDGRVEYFTDGSYNADPPGLLIHNVREPKFEGQINYTHALGKLFSATVGVQYHHNFRFQDNYWWGMAGAIFSRKLGEKFTLTLQGLVEKKFITGRLFLDGSGTLEYRFAPKWNTQLSFHRYENFAELDFSPSQKFEYELGVNRSLSHNQSIGMSFFRHVQIGGLNGPNDQFSFLRLKYGVAF